MSDPDARVDRVRALAGRERAKLGSRLHLATYVSTTLVAGGLLGANLRVNGIAMDFMGGGVETSPIMDTLVRFYFFRGWPLSPWMFCLYHGNRFREADLAVVLTSVLNVVVACLILKAVAFVCELFARRPRRDA